MKRLLKGGLLLAIVLAVWYIASTKVNSLFIPSPSSVFEGFRQMLKSGMLKQAIWYSFRRITIATLISAGIAMPVGLLVYNYKIAKDFISPIIGLMRYLPVTAFYPLLIMYFGIDERMKIAFLFIATFVYMMPSVVLCLGEINSDLIDTGLTIGMSKLQIISKVQIPSTLPSILNSFIMMYGIGFSYIAVAETVNAKYGLGYIIQQSSARGRTDLVFMAIIVIMSISVLFDTISKWIVRKIFKWRYINDKGK